MGGKCRDGRLERLHNGLLSGAEEGKEREGFPPSYRVPS